MQLGGFVAFIGIQLPIHGPSFRKTAAPSFASQVLYSPGEIFFL